MPNAFDALARWGAALAVVVLLQTGVQAVEQGEQPTSGRPPTLVFVTKSDACDCQADLCVVGEQEVRNFLADNPWGFRRETVDLEDNPEAAKELRVLAVPVVFLLDGTGRRVARFDGFFSERDLLEAWNAHLNGGKKQ